MLGKYDILNIMPDDTTCPKCNSPFGEVTETASGKRLQRCSQCSYVKWLPVEPKALDEKCPKCGLPLVLQITRFGKKMKKCSAGGWDKATRKPTGCDYIEWINGTTQALPDKCPDCGNPLVLFTTNSGKRMIKCSTSGWDKIARKATGCAYIQWLKPGERVNSTGEEFLPPEDNQSPS